MCLFIIQSSGVQLAVDFSSISTDNLRPINYAIKIVFYEYKTKKVELHLKRN